MKVRCMKESFPVSERAINADSLWSSPGHGELSEVLHLLSDNLDASLIGGIELQHSLFVQLWTGGGQCSYKRRCGNE